MANVIIPQIVIVDPTTGFPAAFAPGESLLLQRAPNGLVQGIYNYPQLPEFIVVAPGGNIAETRALALLSTVRLLRFV